MQNKRHRWDAMEDALLVRVTGSGYTSGGKNVTEATAWSPLLPQAANLTEHWDSCEASSEALLAALMSVTGKTLGIDGPFTSG